MYRVIFLSKGKWVTACDEIGNEIFEHIEKAFRISNNIINENPVVAVKVQKLNPCRKMQCAI